MGRLEVLKVVGANLVERPGVRDRFLREVQSAAKLHHTNIVGAYSALRLDNGLVLAMEYVEGLDLQKMVKTKGPLPVANACYFIHQAALGLQHAHERGMVHRDIKPANLILAAEGKKAVVKVLDFGLAKVSSEGQTDSGLTREGQMLGTPDYIAPEQIRNAQSADIRADIYSLGCTFYYLLSGGPPFRGEHLWDVYQAHFSMDAGPLNLVRPEVPVELAALVAKMMAKDPGRRFQTPGEVARALTPFFKPAATQPTVSTAEISHVNRPVAPTQVSAGAGPARLTADGRGGGSNAGETGAVEARGGGGGVGEPDRIAGDGGIDRPGEAETRSETESYSETSNGRGADSSASVEVAAAVGLRRHVRLPHAGCHHLRGDQQRPNQDRHRRPKRRRAVGWCNSKNRGRLGELITLYALVNMR